MAIDITIIFQKLDIFRIWNNYNFKGSSKYILFIKYQHGHIYGITSLHLHEINSEDSTEERLWFALISREVKTEVNSSDSSLITAKYEQEDFAFVKNRNFQLEGLFSVQALLFPHKEKSVKKVTIITSIDFICKHQNIIQTIL